MIETKINKMISMISNLNEDEWEKCPQVSGEKNEKFERQKAKLRNQAKMLDKIIESTQNGKIEITQSDTENLFDDSSTSDEEDLMFKSKINETFKAHSDSELDSEAIPFYFRDNTSDDKNECLDIDQ
jgi:hypothetical protein